MQEILWILLYAGRILSLVMTQLVIQIQVEIESLVIGIWPEYATANF